MDIIIPILTCLVIAVVFFFIGKNSIKTIKPSSEEILKYSIENIEFLNELNPLVKQIYLYFTDKTTLKHFHELSHEIRVDVIKVDVWKCNNVDDRRFTSISDNTMKMLDKTLDEINNSLSLADKKVLDRIVKAIATNNREFISRLFI